MFQAALAQATVQTNKPTALQPRFWNDDFCQIILPIAKNNTYERATEECEKLQKKAVNDIYEEKEARKKVESQLSRAEEEIEKIKFDLDRHRNTRIKLESQLKKLRKEKDEASYLLYRERSARQEVESLLKKLKKRTEKAIKTIVNFIRNKDVTKEH